MKIAAIVLAAGASTRLGQPKQLVTYQGEMLIARATRLAHESGAACVIAVLGAKQELVQKHAHPGTLTVLHPGWSLGMASSVRAGVQAVEQSLPDADGVLLLACDQPAVTAEHLRLLMASLAAHEVAASQYANRRGVPAAFRRSQFDALKQLKGDEGARSLLRGESVAEVPLANGDFDIDTPDDLARL